MLGLLGWCSGVECGWCFLVFFVLLWLFVLLGGYDLWYDVLVFCWMEVFMDLFIFVVLFFFGVLGFFVVFLDQFVLGLIWDLLCCGFLLVVGGLLGFFFSFVLW